jgi:hypothetical protein
VIEVLHGVTDSSEEEGELLTVLLPQEASETLARIKANEERQTSDCFFMDLIPFRERL